MEFDGSFSFIALPTDPTYIYTFDHSLELRLLAYSSTQSFYLWSCSDAEEVSGGEQGVSGGGGEMQEKTQRFDRREELRSDHAASGVSSSPHSSS